MNRESYKQHKELIEAWANGAEIETYNKNICEWEQVKKPLWGIDIEYRIKPKKYELKSGDWFVTTDYSFCVKQELTHNDYRKAGLERQTKEQAESLAKYLKRTARLHALVCGLGGLKEFENETKNYYVFRSDGRWTYYYYIHLYVPGIVYMTEECADKVVEILNNCEFDLDGE